MTQQSPEQPKPNQPEQKAPQHKSKIHEILHKFADDLGNALGEAMENRG